MKSYQTKSVDCHLTQLIVLFYPVRVQIWDLAILVPNILFLAFLGLRFNRAILKLRATSSPIFLTFYGLVSYLAFEAILWFIV